MPRLFASYHLILIQVDALKSTLLQFYGPDPSLSPDLARIASDRQVARVASLLSHAGTAARIVHGGEIDPATRWVGGREERPGKSRACQGRGGRIRSSGDKSSGEFGMGWLTLVKAPLVKAVRQPHAEATTRCGGWNVWGRAVQPRVV